jgi:hypothetical protein
MVIPKTWEVSHVKLRVKVFSAFEAQCVWLNSVFIGFNSYFPNVNAVAIAQAATSATRLDIKKKESER